VHRQGEFAQESGVVQPLVAAGMVQTGAGSTGAIVVALEPDDVEACAAGFPLLAGGVDPVSGGEGRVTQEGRSSIPQGTDRWLRSSRHWSNGSRLQSISRDAQTCCSAHLARMRKTGIDGPIEAGDDPPAEGRGASGQGRKGEAAEQMRWVAAPADNEVSARYKS
jgi:hypothetical protein